MNGDVWITQCTHGGYSFPDMLWPRHGVKKLAVIPVSRKFYKHHQFSSGTFFGGGDLISNMAESQQNPTRRSIPIMMKAYSPWPLKASLAAALTQGHENSVCVCCETNLEIALRMDPPKEQKAGPMRFFSYVLSKSQKIKQWQTHRIHVCYIWWHLPSIYPKC